MGVFSSPFLTFLFSLFLIFVLFPLSFADNDYINTTSNVASNPSPSLHEIRPNSSAAFKPSIAVIVGVLTTLFSVTFLLLLYAKHCKRNAYIHGHGSSALSFPVSARKNSGINRVVVESLPLFRFSSLRGQKDGLECAVCLTRFELNELLRLLPKCKHAFHVECVDTWLDAHSTCPLCRYRVDPEDILLIVDDSSRQNQNQNQDPTASPTATASSTVLSSSSCSPFNHITESDCSRTHRISGRHSYNGEKTTSSSSKPTWSLRRSLDSRGATAAMGVGAYRKDGLLLSREEEIEKTKRLEHRIIVSGSGNEGDGSSSRSGFHQRWSDVQPSDLLYLRSEMIISQNHKLRLRSLAEAESRNNNNSNNYGNGKKEAESSEPETECIDQSAINSRSVSEITGLSRFSSNSNQTNNNAAHHHRRQGQAVTAAVKAGVISRWMAWISSTRPQPGVVDTTTCTSLP